MKKFDFEEFWQRYLQILESDRNDFLEKQKNIIEQADAQTKKDFYEGLQNIRMEIKQQFEQLISQKITV